MGEVRRAGCLHANGAAPVSLSVNFRSASDVERYVESADIDLYRVFDSRGVRLRLVSNEAPPIGKRIVSMVPVQLIEPDAEEYDALRWPRR